MEYLKLILFFLSILLVVHSELLAWEESVLSLYVQNEKVSKSVDMLKLKVDMMEKFHHSAAKKFESTFEEKQTNRNRVRAVFDARIDSLPFNCEMEQFSSNCAQATECTQTSGYYNITVSRYSSHTFLAFCDYRTQGGDWLHILQRVDGTENFNRPWSDYVKGFGEVDHEYWIGLENLYALTNHDGPQELYIYMENFNGDARHARYDHFKIGNAAENYKLKSLGKYSGDAGDAMQYTLGQEFSTFDAERDKHETFNCAQIHKGGWWFNACSRTVPTGFYHRGNYRGEYADGIFWRDWLEYWHSMKFFVMMIRRQRIFTDD